MGTIDVIFNLSLFHKNDFSYKDTLLNRIIEDPRFYEAYTCGMGTYAFRDRSAIPNWYSESILTFISFKRLEVIVFFNGKTDSAKIFSDQHSSKCKIARLLKKKMF